MAADRDRLTQERARLGLSRDCTRCFGLCCVALQFKASAGFPVDKPPGTPCLHLQVDHGCRVHGELAERGLTGCITYDCLGAGQRISQDAPDWRTAGADSSGLFQALPPLSELHLWLWYLTEADSRTGRRDVHSLLQQAEELASGPPLDLSWGDVDRLGREALQLLGDVSVRLRADAVGRTHPRGELPTDLVGRDLRGVDLHGIRLVGRDLTGADLRFADLLGADLRGTDLSGADLTDALFLTRGQLDSARGDAATRVSPWVPRPAHWVD